MLYITDYSKAKDFHNDLVRCWLTTKVNGRKGVTYPNGHNCGKITCPVCTVTTQKADLPQMFIDFMNRRKNIEILVNGLPNELRLLSLRYKNLHLNDNERNLVKENFNRWYDNWFQPFYGFTFLGFLNFNTCVYCNRNYTRTIKDIDGKKVLISQMDHWFPQAHYPLLSLSFYNLIPCCSSCNSSIKTTNTRYNWDRALRNMVHPYLPSNNEAFSFSYICKSSSAFNVRVIAPTNSKISKTLVFFKILEVYNSHSDLELKSLLDLRFKYPENYVSSLINTYFKGIMDRPEIYRNIFGVETLEKDYHKRSLNKFKRDIIEELLKT